MGRTLLRRSRRPDSDKAGSEQLGRCSSFSYSVSSQFEVANRPLLGSLLATSWCVSSGAVMCVKADALSLEVAADAACARKPPAYHCAKALCASPHIV